MFKIVISGVMVAFILASAQGCAPSAEKNAPVVIGYLGPLSGRSSGLGLAGRDGALLAVEEANAAGGFAGRRIELAVEDDGGGTTATVAGVGKLAKSDAVAIIGPLTSSSAVAATPVADKLGIPLLSPTVSSTDLSDQDDMFLRTCADNRTYAEQLAARVGSQTPDARVALAFDTGNRAYTERVCEHFADAIRDGGGFVVATATFESGTNPDYSRTAKQLVTASPQVVFIAANSIDSGLLSQRVREHGFDGTIALSQWSVTDNLVESGGRAVDGATFMDNWNRDSKDPAFTKFLSAFEKRFNYPVSFAAIHSYDATRMLLAAARKNPEREAIKAALIGGRPFLSTQGPIDIDEMGDTERPFYPMSIRDGAYVAAPER